MYAGFHAALQTLVIISNMSLKVTIAECPVVQIFKRLGNAPICSVKDSDHRH